MVDTATGIFSTSQREVRQAAAQLVEGIDGFWTGNVTSSADTTHFVAADRLEPNDYFNGFWVLPYKGTTTYERRIVDFAAGASPTFQLASAMGGSIDNTWSYEIHRYIPPSIYNTNLNLVITNVNYINPIPIGDTSLTLITAQQEYTIPTGFKYIYEVDIDLDSSDWYRISPGAWEVVRNTGKLKIDLMTVNNFTGHALRILGFQNHSAPSNETSVIAINPNYLIYQTAFRVCTMKGSGDASGGWLAKAKMFFDLAETEKRNMNLSFPNNTRKVGY